MKIVILGGGLAGLSAARELILNNEVIILEKEDYLGGLASGFEYKCKRIPKYYHHVFFHDNVTKSLLKEASLNLTWKKILMGIAANNKIYNFTNLSGFLKFDYLSFIGKIRYGLFGAYVFFLMNPDKIKDDVNARQWLMKYAGEEVTSKLFHQLYAVNKFGISLDEISAKQFAYRLKAKEAMGKFGYPIKSLDKMIDFLEDQILKKNGKIIKKVNIKEIDLKKKEIKYNNEKIKYDILINTIPFPEFIKISKNLPENYKNKISKIKYCPCVSVVFGTREFLSKHYWVNILNERISMVMQHSNLFDGYDTKINWALRYGGSEQDINLNDSEIKKFYFGVVKKYFNNCEIIWSKVFVEKYASPIYDKNYFLNNPGYKTPVDGLYNAGVSVTYPEIRNMNTALKSGIKIAKVIKNEL